MPTFDFAFDGKVDMMSLNPLEVTNFEMMGGIFGIAAVLIAILLDRYAKRRRQPPHVFAAHEAEDGVAD